jgi:hypothetical protein
LYQAEGGSISVTAGSYTSDFGMGYFDGQIELGARLRTRLFGSDVTAGDDTVDLRLPTDVFGSNPHFLVRGLGVSRSSEGNRLYVFAGSTSEGVFTPFFNAGRSDRSLAAIFEDRRLTRTVRIVSRNLFASKTTSIQAVEWSPKAWIKASAAAGFGVNRPYAATAVSIERHDVSAHASYAAESREFERLANAFPQTSELEKENIAVSYRPTKLFSISATHENILQTVDAQSAVRGTVNEVSAGSSVARFSIGSSFFESHVSGHTTLGANLSVMRPITSRVSVSGNVFQSYPDVGNGITTYAGNVHAALTTKFSVIENVTSSGGQTTFGTGGEFVTNRCGISLTYENVYVPFRLSSPFERALALNVRFAISSETQLTGGSFVDPLGHTRYTFGINKYFYRFKGKSGVDAPGPLYRFPKYSISGIVLDVGGNPIGGAAIHVGDQVAYSDAHGRFMVRVDKRAPYKLTVALDEFIVPGVFEVNESPTIATPGNDGTASVKIVLTRRHAATMGSR